MINYSFTMVSGNSKLGPMPAVISGKPSCPSHCPLKKENGGGCYAAAGRIQIHWMKLDNSGLSFDMLINHIKTIPNGRIWRMNTAGDLDHKDNKIDAKKLSALVKANKNKRGFCYTHHDPSIGSNAKAISAANKNGFTINLSADSLEEADKLADYKIGPVVTIVPSTQKTNTVTPKGRKVVICPNYTRNVQCVDCGLCQKAERGAIVAFPAHGIAYKKVDKMVDGK